MPETLPKTTPLRDLDTPQGILLRNMVYGLALAVMVGWILYMASGVLVPMILGLLLAYMVFGLSLLMGAIPIIGSRIPSGIRILMAFLILCYALVQMVASFAANISAFIVLAPQYQTQLLSMIQHGASLVGFEGDLSWESVRRDVFAEVNIQSLLRSGLASTASLLIGLIFVLVNVIFMLLEQPRFDQKLANMSSDPARIGRLRIVIADINDKVGRYLAVKTMINIGLGLSSYAVMYYAGLEFAALWAILIAVMNYIPYIGTWIGLAFPLAISIVQFGDIEPVLLLFAVMAALQTLSGYVIEPQVMGKSLDLSPYAILISLTAWASLWGVAGAIISVPITAVMVIIFSEFSGSRPIAVLLSRTGNIPDRRLI
jgi:AI-2 transport protein TqsA